MAGFARGIRTMTRGPRRAGGRGLNRGRAVCLSLFWLWLVFGTSSLAETSGNVNNNYNGNGNGNGNGNDNDNDNDNVAAEKNRTSTSRNGSGDVVHEHPAEHRTAILPPKGEDPLGKGEILKPQRFNERSAQHLPGDRALPEDSQFLSGPSSDEHSLYSDISCTCHSSKSSPLFPNECSGAFSATSTVTSDSGKDDKPLATCSEQEADGDETPCLGRVFYLISIHNERTLTDALYLFRAIRDARNIVLIHIDAKFGLEPYHGSPLDMEIEACPCGATVEVASVHDCKWGSWSMNLPTLWSMTKAVTEYAGRWDVFSNLSGDTLPVYSADRIARLFGGPLRGVNFVTSVACETGLLPTPIGDFPEKWHKRGHYSHRPPTHLEYTDDDGVVHHDATVEIHFGSQWVSLTPQFCEFLVKQLARPDSLPSRFRDWLVETEKLMADETFFTSMLVRFFPETLPRLRDKVFLDDPDVSMYAIRYERMDEHVPTSRGYYPTEQRYEVPASTGIETPRPWGPYFLGTYDLYNIRTSGALYVRKVARAIDPNLYTIFPVDRPEQIPPIAWPAEVNLGPVPNWKKKVAEMRRKAAEKQLQKEAEKQSQQ